MGADGAARAPLRLLYLVYWGALEPLGRALVVPPVLRFAEAGAQVTLISFEKPEDLAKQDEVRRTAEVLRKAGVEWRPRRYHQRPTAPATVWDIAQGCAAGLAAAARRRPHVVVGRTYVGGLMGRLASRMLRRPFVFHAEGFWPDEQVAAGIWSREDWQYRLTSRSEHALYRSADAVIALSEAARRMVLKQRAAADPGTTVVVPSCVELDRFRGLEGSPAGSPCRLVYAGSLGGRYRVDQIARFLKAARAELPAVELTVYSQSSAELIRSEMRQNGIEDGGWNLARIPHAEIPAALARQSAGLHFLSPGVYVGSPTKVGEYWAAGIPVVTTSHTGDVDAAIERERVGVVLPGDSDDACREAARELRVLLADPGLPDRCRAAAEHHYSLTRGVETQLELYARLRALA